jgi:hypothetical protein
VDAATWINWFLTVRRLGKEAMLGVALVWSPLELTASPKGQSLPALREKCYFKQKVGLSGRLSCHLSRIDCTVKRAALMESLCTKRLQQLELSTRRQGWTLNTSPVLAILDSKYHISECGASVTGSVQVLHKYLCCALMQF